MKLKVKKINFETGNVKVVVLNSEDANKMGGKAGDHVLVKNLDSKTQKPLIAILDISYSDSIVASGELGILLDAGKSLKLAERVSIVLAEPPSSFKFIKKKIDGQSLNSEEINNIISDAASGLLSQIELTAFITGVSINGMNNNEMTALTLAEARSGEIFDFGSEVFDKHSTYIAISVM